MVDAFQCGYGMYTPAGPGNSAPGDETLSAGVLECHPDGDSMARPIARGEVT